MHRFHGNGVQAPAFQELVRRVVAPGRIATPRVRANYTDAEWETAAKRIPLGHAGQPEDVAEAVVYLAGDTGKHITGQTIHVNGGRIMT